MASETANHPYHLVEPSPWPLLSSIAAMAMTVGAVLWFHDHTQIVFWIGLAGVLGCMVGWWRDVLRESVAEGAHSKIVKIGLRYGMALFIASEVMFFLAFFWAYFNAALWPREYIDGAYQAYSTVVGAQGVWPPEYIKTFDPFHLPFMMTLVLLLSGCTVTWAHHAILEGKRKEMIQALAITVGLGVFFTMLQAYEYSKAEFWMDTGVYGSTFFMATGFHGLHVIIGTLFLAVCLFRAMRGHFTKESHFGFEAAAWYWHFVDVVWLFLFCAVYWFGAGDVAH